MWIKPSEPTLTINGATYDQGAIDLSRINALQKAFTIEHDYVIYFYIDRHFKHEWRYFSEELRDKDYDTIMRMLRPVDLSSHNPDALTNNPYTLAKEAYNNFRAKDRIDYGDFEMGFVLGYTAKV